MRRFTPLALCCALILGAPAQAEPFTVDHLLALEELGPVRIDPSQRWAVIQTYRRWDQAQRYDLDYWTLYSLGDLRVVDLARASTPRRLSPDDGAGYVAGPFSPSGRYMVILRVRDGDWELGVVRLADGDIRWLGLAPEIPSWGRSIVWRGETELVAAVRAGDHLNRAFGIGWQAQARLTQQWAAQARGETTAAVAGSGRYRAITPRTPQGRLVRVTWDTAPRVETLAVGDFVDLELAPDGRRVAAFAQGAESQAGLEGPVYSGTAYRRQTLTLVDLTTGRASQPCGDCDVMARLMAWSGSGRELIVYARRGDVGWSKGGFLRISEGGATPLAMPGLEPALGKAADNSELASATWLGETPVVYARPLGSAQGRSDWRQLTANGWRNLTAKLPEPSRFLVAKDAETLTVRAADAIWRVSADGKTARLDGDGPLGDLSDPPQSERLLVNAPRPLANLTRVSKTAGRIRLVSAAPGGPTIVLPAADGAELLAASPMRRGAIMLDRSAAGVQRLSLVRPGQPPLALVTLNGWLDKVEPARRIAVRHASPDGKAQTSWLYLPAHPSSERSPLVVIPYPGDNANTRFADQSPGLARLLTNAQVLAGHGYAVLVPALPYQTDKEPAEGFAAQVEAVVDAAVAQGGVDGARVAVWGHSYGAYAALLLATQSKRFDAIVASAGPSDLASFYGKTGVHAAAFPELGSPIAASAAWAETSQGRMMVPPWVDPERYIRNSPFFAADKVTAPVMLIYGDLDKDLGQTQQMFAALYRQNKDAQLIIYRGETHVMIAPGNVRDQYARILAFLDEAFAKPADAAPTTP